MNFAPLLLNEIFQTIYNLTIIIYDINEKNIDDKKLLKKLSLIILKLFVEKLIKELIYNFIIESNIILKVKDLYKKKKFQ